MGHVLGNRGPRAGGRKTCKYRRLKKDRKEGRPKNGRKRKRRKEKKEGREGGKEYSTVGKILEIFSHIKLLINILLVSFVILKQTCFLPSKTKAILHFELLWI